MGTDPFAEQPSDTSGESVGEAKKSAWLKLDITGSPAGATLTADDEVLGTTPMVKPVKRDRELLDLVISKEGYQDLQVGVALEGKEIEKIEYELEKVARKQP